jgi:hypothetical protein
MNDTSVCFTFQLLEVQRDSSDVPLTNNRSISSWRRIHIQKFNIWQITVLKLSKFNVTQKRARGEIRAAHLQNTASSLNQPARYNLVINDSDDHFNLGAQTLVRDLNAKSPTKRFHGSRYYWKREGRRARNTSYLKVMNCSVFIVITVICCAHNDRSSSEVLQNTHKFIYLQPLVHTTLKQTFYCQKQFSVLNGCMEMKYYTLVKMFRWILHMSLK